MTALLIVSAVVAFLVALAVGLCRVAGESDDLMDDHEAQR